jgi:hypothetical protein
MKFEKAEVFNFEGAIRGMRNPMESYEKSDSGWIMAKTPDCVDPGVPTYVIGQNDLDLAQRLIKAGPEHRKFMRQIFVCVDITAPIYWWNEFDTYQVGTTRNSTSKMHKIATTPITIDCFETDDLSPNIEVSRVGDAFYDWIGFLECLRVSYLKTKDKRYWKELIRLLPESWLQRRTVTMTYENVYSIIRQRRGHKLTEWSGMDEIDTPSFMKFAHSLPYSDKLLFLGLEPSRKEVA